MDIATIMTLIILVMLVIQIIDYHRPSSLRNWFRRVQSYSKLSRLVGKKTADRLIEGIAKHYPGRSRDWCIERKSFTGL